MDIEKISKLIKDIRKKNNLSQKEFAEQFNVTYQAVSKWENGKNMPDIEIIKDICSKYNISLDDFLDNKINNNKKRNWLFISFIISFLVTIIIFLLLKNSNFEFKTISSNCHDFTVTGSLAYNKEKTSIYISTVNYCGNEDDIIFDKINCTLYEEDGNLKKTIQKCDYKENVKLKDFLKDLTFNIDDYKLMCQKTKDNHFVLEIEGLHKEKTTSYKIPLKLSNNCGVQKELD